MSSVCAYGSVNSVWINTFMFFRFILFPFSTCTNFFSYGIFSFGLIFLVEGRGILQATLTLNGLVGGILLGLFSLGIFFKNANVKVNVRPREMQKY